MKALSYAVAALLAAASPIFAETYPLTEDSKAHEGVPKGEKLSLTFADSKIFPGTTRNVTIYVPRQYDPAKPACVWVNQDGVQNNAPVVFDNLIARGEMPVTIYIAASPGVVKALDGKVALDRFNRSLEYDGLGDSFADFILDELLPFVEKQKTSDGRPIVLSKNGNDRCLGGSSSGAICAFNAAWERPDAFRRVFSTIGTYVSLRGADRLPGLIRKYEPKGLRVFLQDGDHDQNIYGGDWWMANQMMERALAFAGYEVNHAWGTGGHDGAQGAAVFPDAVRWLWKDWPKEPQIGKNGNAFLNEILQPGEGWQLVGEGYEECESATSNAKGEVFFTDPDKEVTYRVGLDGKVQPFLTKNKRVTSQTFGADGRLYQASDSEVQVLAYDEQGAPTRFTDGLSNGHLVSLHNGGFYLAGDPSAKGGLWYLSPKGERQKIKGISMTPGGIVTSPDQSLLYVSDWLSHWVYSYQIQPDGGLKDGQRYYHLHVPDDEDDADANGMTVDTAGRLYVATSMGIQVCDQAGRVNCIIQTPNYEVSSITFDGPDFDTLYATVFDKVYKRKTKVKGAPSFAAPIKPAAPHL